MIWARLRRAVPAAKQPSIPYILFILSKIRVLRDWLMSGRTEHEPV